MNNNKNLSLNYASLAKVTELFKYKESRSIYEIFPGYSYDQWGIKAHNRPWIEENGQFKIGQKILEVGAGYSLFPKYLAKKYNIEAWVADDFGLNSDEPIWSRWGNPIEFTKKHPEVKYIFERFGSFSNKFPDRYFDRIFTVSTLEHIKDNSIAHVLKDINRCLKPGGKILHTIDIQVMPIKRLLIHAIGDKFNLLRQVTKKFHSNIFFWMNKFTTSGVIINTNIPNSIQLLDRQILVESPDVVFRFYPPNNFSKPYNPSASLLLIIEKEK
jgi:SAM-dependent methyltransferase